MSNFRADLLTWYDAAKRDLPWRGAGQTPYRVLVSEAMLQQTTVKAVIPYFNRFTAALPTVRMLADADEQTVLRLWQGLGYYSRARNLRKAAMVIVERHGGEVPRTVEELLSLPGVGRYTAGAIASIAYDVAAPILDGNVQRVLCRLDLIDDNPRTPAVQRRLWSRAAELVQGERPGDFNSAMMELGATVCVPRSPQCLICPVSSHCAARAAGVQDRIPPAKVAKPTPLIERDIFRLTNAAGEVLIEQRPTPGRWAGLWQFVTRPRGQPPPVAASDLRQVGEVAHGLTHRRYHFRVFAGTSDAPAPPPARWVSTGDLDAYPMPKPHLRAREMTGIAKAQSRKDRTQSGADGDVS